MKEVYGLDVERRLIAGEKLNIIDVREHEEVVNGVIPGAIHIPLGELEFRMNELEKDKEYIIVCHSGGRSALATQFLSHYGYKAANLVGGMLYWEGPVENYKP